MQRSPYEEAYHFCPTCQTILIPRLVESKQRLYCNHCGFTFWNNPKPVVSAILCFHEKILMIQRAHKPLQGFWCLPGGIMDYEETMQEALKREVFEEVGLGLEIQNLCGVYRIDNDPRGVTIDMIYRLELSHDMTAQIQLSEEHTQWKWFTKDALPQQIAYKHREAIRDFYALKHAGSSQPRSVASSGSKLCQ